MRTDINKNDLTCADKTGAAAPGIGIHSHNHVCVCVCVCVQWKMFCRQEVTYYSIVCRVVAL